MNPKQTKKSKMLGRNILIAKFIEQGNTLSLPKLANVFHCSTRTIYRSLEAIKKAEEATKGEREILFPSFLFKKEE